MIQQRWKKYDSRNNDIRIPEYAVNYHGDPWKGVLYMVLQMRQVINTLEVANELHPPIWSEWQDVPIEP